MQKYIILFLALFYSCTEKSELKQPVKSINGVYDCVIESHSGLTYNQKWTVDDLGNGRIRVSPQTSIIPVFNANYSDGRIDVIADYYNGVYVTGSGSGNDSFISLKLRTIPGYYWEVDGVK